MTYEIVFVLVVAAAALVLFAMDRIRLDQLSMSVPVVLLLAGSSARPMRSRVSRARPP